MSLNLSGIWQISLDAIDGRQEGEITIPGILQNQGFGNKITKDTKWVSSLHDPLFWEREEYKQPKESDEFLVSFLAQPKRHFTGKAYYTRKINIDVQYDGDWYLFIEQTRWKTTVYIDDRYVGEDESLCTSHIINCGKLSSGEHTLKVVIDNSMIHPYRPDSHGVSDALAASWNGMTGEVSLLTENDILVRKEEKKEYAIKHPRKIECIDGRFVIDGEITYLRGTHFGGDYPMTGYAPTDKEYWTKFMKRLKTWGINFVRCHSYCPPDAAFAAADEEGIYLQPECGMWNHFGPGEPMLEILNKETKRILAAFGHHPSFVLFSPTNEPSGKWYQVLREWVSFARTTDEELGYSKRRVYTAQSGWYYEVEPSKITGTDYIYFHRSNFGKIYGGMIRNYRGWKGKDYSASVENAKLPIVSHELGQWCAYPDFSIIDKMNGYLVPGNFKLIYENCKRSGLLSLSKEMTYASGRNQLRLLKEDIEATRRTKEIQGYELLDIHDYLGQGTALVGVLDALWEEKGYVSSDEYKLLQQEVMILPRFTSYVFTSDEERKTIVDISNYSKKDIVNAKLVWRVLDKDIPINQGSHNIDNIKSGNVIQVMDNLSFDFSGLTDSKELLVEMTLVSKDDTISYNKWPITVFVEKKYDGDVIYTKDWIETKQLLEKGKKVIFEPELSTLSYECPPCSIRNVFWNAQMGPTWGRSLGLLINNDHAIFKSFPTAMDGGWQWENILNNARGFYISEFTGLEPIVRVIDDWNRNLSLGLIYEGKVGDGKLIVVSANLDGDYKECPEAYSLKQSLLKYAASDYFNPVYEIELSKIEDQLFDFTRMERIVDSLSGSTVDLIDSNPNKSGIVVIDDDPCLRIDLKEKTSSKGFIIFPEQKDRSRDAFVKKIKVDIDECDYHKEYHLLNTTLSQKILFDRELVFKSIRITFLETYGGEESFLWEEPKKEKRIVKLSGLHLLYDGQSFSSSGIKWNEQQTSTTKEIDN